jgi:lipopolysaccharide export LptBFGC system permease protein LptF
MTPPPSLSRPDHLTPPKPRWSDELRARAAGISTLVVGIAGLVAVTTQQRQLTTQPDWRLSVPFFVVAAALAAAALARKEPSRALPLLGLALAAAAMVLGIFLAAAALVLGIAVLVLVFS